MWIVLLLLLRPVRRLFVRASRALFVVVFTTVVVAFGVGLAVIAFLMQYLKRGSFLPFVIYRVLLGIVLIVLLSFGVLQAY